MQTPTPSTTSQKASPTLAQTLKELGFSHLLELALFVPHSYLNTMPIQALRDGEQGALRIEVIDTHTHPKVFKIYARALDLEETIEIVFFHAKPFVKKLFAKNTTLIIQGTVRLNGFMATMIQPKILHDIGKILPQFKSTKHKNDKLIKITQHLVTTQNLTAIGLPYEVATSLNEIFHPTKALLEAFSISKTFSGKWLYALKFSEIFYHITQLAKKRHSFSAKFICNGDYTTFVQSLPFQLTNAQKRVCAEIAHDLSQTKAAKRLIMGDVGCGKTMIILASVLMAYPKKSLLMAPTTVLAKQLYEQAKLYLPSHINTVLISADSKQDLNGLFGYDIDFIIGTQALLYRDIRADELALVMSDEQHRFGTKQRHYLEKIATSSDTSDTKKPHVLQFSATPIPRTMAMLESKLIDVSIIDELPYPKDITTRIIGKKDFKELLEHIKTEVAHAHQIALIYPLVEESQSLDYLSIKEGENFWKTRFNGVYSTSGQDKEKENVLEEFAQKGSILLATTLIEVGISLPKLSTIVIIAPERLGLATLHQLRGRVSRNGLKGYCFLYTQHPDSARLHEFAAHLDGFDIAQIDLKYRKSGDLLNGKRQSGAEWVFADLSEDESIFVQANAHFQKQTKSNASN